MAKPIGTHTKIIGNWKLSPKETRFPEAAEIRNFQMEFGRGFTLTELIITISIMVTLLSLVAINLSFAQRRTSLNNTTSAIIADLKQQQTKAMVGDTEGRATADNYGVYFQDNNYVLFHGSSYNASDSANSTINLESSQQFTTSNAAILFTRVSGDILGYSSASAVITLKDKSSGNMKTIQFNQYGVVTSVN